MPLGRFWGLTNDPEASISTESALMCTQCTRNMLGTTFVSHTQSWKTPQHRQNREKTRKSRCSHSQSHIGANSLPKAPMKMKKNVPEKPYMHENAPIYTNALGICSEQMLAHVWHLRKQYKTNKTKMLYLLCFCDCFFFGLKKWKYE